MSGHIVSILVLWLMVNAAILAHCFAVAAEDRRRDGEWHDA